MSRKFDSQEFEQKYQKYICEGIFNEEPHYYPRYKSRYKSLIKRFAAQAGSDKLKVLDIGGGQLSLMCRVLWQDDAVAADIGGPHLNYLKDNDVETVEWNLCEQESPFQQTFDVVFFSEVIEHLPIPGHLVLEKLRAALKPGGLMLCSTPNLYRMRNRVYMLIGRQIFDYFRYPKDSGLGHVLEYSIDHLQWQFEQAQFENIKIDYEQMHHFPNNPVFRLLYLLGSPLFLVPAFRDNLVVEAYASQ